MDYFNNINKLNSTLLSISVLEKDDLFKRIILMKGIMEEYLKIFPEYNVFAEITVNEILKNFSNKDVQTLLAILKNNGITFDLLRNNLIQRGGVNDEWGEESEEQSEDVDDGKTESERLIDLKNSIRTALGNAVSPKQKEDEPIQPKPQPKVGRIDLKNFSEVSKLMQSRSGSAPSQPQPASQPQPVSQPLDLSKFSAIGDMLQSRPGAIPNHPPLTPQSRVPIPPSLTPQSRVPIPPSLTPQSSVPIPPPLPPQSQAGVVPKNQPIIVPNSSASELAKTVSNGMALQNEFFQKEQARLSGVNTTKTDEYLETIQLLNKTALAALEQSRTALENLSKKEPLAQPESDAQTALRYRQDNIRTGVALTAASATSFGLLYYFFIIEDSFRTVLSLPGETVGGFLDYVEPVFKWTGNTKTELIKLIKESNKENRVSREKIYNIVKTQSPQQIMEDINKNFIMFLNDKVLSLKAIQQTVNKQISQYEAEIHDINTTVSRFEELNANVTKLNNELATIETNIKSIIGDDSSFFGKISAKFTEFSSVFGASRYKELTDKKKELLQSISDASDKLNKTILKRLKSDGAKEKARAIAVKLNELVQNLNKSKLSYSEDDFNNLILQINVSAKNYTTALINYDVKMSSPLSSITKFIPTTETKGAVDELTRAKTAFMLDAEQLDDLFGQFGNATAGVLAEIDAVEKSGNITNFLAQLPQLPLVTEGTAKAVASLALASATEGMMKLANEMTRNQTVAKAQIEMAGEEMPNTWGETFTENVSNPIVNGTTSAGMIPVVLIVTLVFIIVFMLFKFIFKVSDLKKVSGLSFSAEFRGGKRNATKKKVNKSKNRIHTKKYKKIRISATRKKQIRNGNKNRKSTNKK
uniref:Uncharacterized protein n=1 Tax=viral metagenome TaxID=1070528 RepID=A0A6C0BUR6_9ZZZZ